MSAISAMVVDQNVKLLVGTEEGEVLEIVTQQEKEHKEDSVNMDIGSATGVTASVLMRSHSKGTHGMAQGEVWGLAVCPSNPDWIVTGADDGACFGLYPLGIPSLIPNPTPGPNPNPNPNPDNLRAI